MIAAFFISFWVFLMILFSFSVVRAFKEGAEQVKKLHRIPCYKCDFFTNDYRLKCTVNPSLACSEEAIGCIDFEMKTVNCNSSQKSQRQKNIETPSEPTIRCKCSPETKLYNYR